MNLLDKVSFHRFFYQLHFNLHYVIKILLQHSGIKFIGLGGSFAKTLL